MKVSWPVNRFCAYSFQAFCMATEKQTPKVTSLQQNWFCDRTKKIIAIVLISIMEEDSVPSQPGLSCETSLPCSLPTSLPAAARQSPPPALHAQTLCISVRQTHFCVISSQLPVTKHKFRENGHNTVPVTVRTTAQHSIQLQKPHTEFYQCHPRTKQLSALEFVVFDIYIFVKALRIQIQFLMLSICS